MNCVPWSGKLVLSKSGENSITCWKPGLLTQSGLVSSRTNVNITVFHIFDYKDCDIWFLGFPMDLWQRVTRWATLTSKN